MSKPLPQQLKTVNLLFLNRDKIVPAKLVKLYETREFHNLMKIATIKPTDYLFFMMDINFVKLTNDFNRIYSQISDIINTPL
jgi:hypothetical protein